MSRRSHRAADASPKQMTLTPEQPDPPPAKRRARTAAGSKATLTWVAMALLTVGSVGDLGATPATAVFGLASVVIYVLPAIVFLLPASLVSAELASGWKGGVYNWVSEGISPRMGFVAIWCQFAQTTFYYPAVLAYIASTLAYVFAPSLAHSGLYTAVVIIVLFWAAVLVSARGVLATGRLASYGIVIGTLIPGLLLVLLAAIYLLQGNASAAPLNAHHVLPAWNGLTSIVLIVNSFFLYAGVEVNAVHVDELRDAPREFPKATLLAVVLVLLVFIFPTLAISVAVPAAHISFTAGVMQAFKSLLDHFGLSVFTPIIAVGLVVASLSGLLDWLTGPSTGLVGHRARPWLPAAVLPGAQLKRRPTAHTRRPGNRHHADRTALRRGAGSLTRVLGVRRPGDRGLPDHVHPDVRRGDQPTATTARAPAWLPGTRARDDLRRRDARLRGRLRGRPAAAEPARTHKHTAIPPGAARRNPARRPPPAAPAPQAAPVRLEGRCLRRGEGQQWSDEGVLDCARPT